MTTSKGGTLRSFLIALALVLVIWATIELI
jgi:hypothetical protein